MSVEKDTSADEVVSQEISQAEQYKNEANEYFKSAYAWIVAMDFLHFFHPVMWSPEHFVGFLWYYRILWTWIGQFVFDKQRKKIY